MSAKTSTSLHDATASALGFRYQERYALLELLDASDEAAVAIEALDDIQLTDNGVDLLEQLKHSYADKPKPIDIKSVGLWTTLRIWAELLPAIDLSRTCFALVTVAPLSKSSSLKCLQTEGSNRTKLVAELTAEAERVIEEVKAAETAGEGKPHAKRLPGVKALLSLSNSAN